MKKYFNQFDNYYERLIVSENENIWGLTMQELINLITGDLKYYWLLALLGSFLFIIQTLLILIFGVGGDDIDVDGDGAIDFGEHADSGFGDFRLLSVRSIVAFITFFGWGGVLYGRGGIAGFIVAVVCGSTMMFLTALAIFYIYKFQQSGNVYDRDLLGKTGSVYLKIPGGRDNCGKVTVNTGSGTREILAVADNEISTGSSVKIVQLISQNKFLVEKI